VCGTPHKQPTRCEKSLRGCVRVHQLDAECLSGTSVSGVLTEQRFTFLHAASCRAAQSSQEWHFGASNLLLLPNILTCLLLSKCTSVCNFWLGRPAYILRLMSVHPACEFQRREGDSSHVCLYNTPQRLRQDWAAQVLEGAVATDLPSDLTCLRLGHIWSGCSAAVSWPPALAEAMQRLLPRAQFCLEHSEMIWV
jgi:hypothetical protein